MAKLTETILLDRTDDSWRSIVNTTNTITIADMTGPVRIRFGISSVSDGITLEPGDVAHIDETVYIRPIIKKRNSEKILSTKVYINRS